MVVIGNLKTFFDSINLFFYFISVDIIKNLTFGDGEIYILFTKCFSIVTFG